MNTVILTNPIQYSYHKKTAYFLQSVLTQKGIHTTVLNAFSDPYPHKNLIQLTKLDPDILITLDLAGFHFRTQSGENALNMLFTKNLNLIWGNRPEYAAFLQKKISLSMLFYDVSGHSCPLSQYYPNVLYYKAMGALLPSPDTPAEDARNRSVFQNIWKDFLSETLLESTV